MIDYTPTTEEIAGWWAHKGGSTDSPYYASKLTKRAKEFDRWLTAHDAEKRAEWEAEQVDMAERWKPVANSADDLLRAVMDALNIRPDQDPVIEARRIAVALAEQGETEWEYGSEGAEGTEDPDPRPLADDNAYWPKSLEGVREPNAEQAAQIVAKWNEGDPGSARLIRRRKAGPWLPVPGSTVRESDSGVRDSDSEESEGKA